MHSRKTAALPNFSLPLEFAYRIWDQAAKRLQIRREGAGVERVAKLPSHIGNDLGVIDGRRPQRTRGEPLPFQQPTLEAMWLRYY